MKPEYSPRPTKCAPRSCRQSATTFAVRLPPLSLRWAASGRPADTLSPEDRAELLATADESLATLSTLVTDLLDVSRVQAGVLAVSLAPVDAAGIVLSAVDELALGPDEVELALDPDLPPLQADPVLLQRVLVNVLGNAASFARRPARPSHDQPPRRHAPRSESSTTASGVAPDRHDDIFAPFQRLGDTDNSTGLGLGFALSKGFTEGMGGTLTPEDTPGGGLTMVIALPVAGPPFTHPSLTGGRR